jgi:hypothetical protein
MAQPATVDAEVRITAVPGPPGPVVFTMRSGIGEGTPQSPLNFRNNGHPGFIVKFDIIDVAGGPVMRFPDDPNDALWVRPIIEPGNECPVAQCSWSQFEPQTVTGNNQTLIVRNRNEFTQKFGFILNLEQIPGAGPPFWSVDPIGNNQNGPQ